MLLQYGSQLLKVSAVHDTHFVVTVERDADGRPPARAERSFLPDDLKSMKAAT
jgi:hypothetical protein